MLAPKRLSARETGFLGADPELADSRGITPRELTAKGDPVIAALLDGAVSDFSAANPNENKSEP